jgi:hypothetical protein
MLPSDKYIASLLGLTDEQYEYWKDYVAAEAKKGPQPAAVCGLETLVIVSIVLTVIGIGFQIVGFLLSRPDRPARLESTKKSGNNQVSVTSFAPRAGFDAIQDVAAIGSPIPVIYANRESIQGKAYGGVRTNLSLLWSQIWSLGGSQMLRAVFMIGEGDIAGLDPNGFAIGDNTIGSYDLLSASGNEFGSRLTVYYRSNGGRITSANRIAGRSAAQDPGNAQQLGGADVFSLVSVNGQWAQDFSAAFKPSNSTTFGVYRLIGNNLNFKLNPLVRPGVNAQLGGKKNNIVECPIDNISNVQRQKFAANFSSRSGIISGGFSQDSTVSYLLSRTSDFLTEYSSGVPTGGTWTSGRELTEAPPVYQTNGSLISIDWQSFLSVASPTVNQSSGTATVRAIFNATDANSALSGIAAGQYRIKYLVSLSNSTVEANLFSFYDIIITVAIGEGSTSLSQVKDGDGFVTDVTITSSSGTVSINYDLEVDVESVVLSPLSNPTRLRADVAFNFSELDAYIERADDVATSVSARQKSWDDAIVVGEIYKIGSAIAVCTGRSPTDAVFRSDSDLGSPNSGQSITATFRIVRSGNAQGTGQADLEAPSTQGVPRWTATNAAQILRVALANIATSRECRIIEIGLRSSLGISISGLLRFRTTLSFEDTDNRACKSKEGQKIGSGKTLKVDQYQSGTVTTSEDRYSFFRVYVRAYSSSEFTPLSQCFGVVSQTQQSVFNYLRIQMPSIGRWEVRFEPLSGWEIRSGVAPGDLYVLDARMSSLQTLTTSTSFGNVVVQISGRAVSRTQANFALLQGQRINMGLPHIDTDNNYVDAWGKLAEAFAYEQIDCTASGGPEHEIVYVNEIIENEQVPNYNGIALVGINARSSFEWAQFRQFSAYVNQGAKVRLLLNNLNEGASHLFPDIALDRFTNPKYGPGRISDDLIDFVGFTAAAQWCQDRNYFFDGPVMLGTDSPRQWAADVASTMLLDFREIGGIYSLSPAFTFSVVEHKALFTAGNIEVDSFRMETIPVDDLRPVRVSAKWREERFNLDPANPGLFPVEREVVVREASPLGSDSDPIESIDLGDYVTNEDHVIDVCKFKIRAKRLRDHVIKFTITYDSVQGICKDIYPGDYIKFALDSTVYSEFNNGAVLGNGSLVSTTPLLAGSYNVIAWDGGQQNPTDMVLVVGGDGTASPTGIIFTVKSLQTQVRTYQISKIIPTEEGKFDVEAVHSPVNSFGLLEIAVDWDNVNSWVISR